MIVRSMKDKGLILLRSFGMTGGAPSAANSLEMAMEGVPAPEGSVFQTAICQKTEKMEGTTALKA